MVNGNIGISSVKKKGITTKVLNQVGKPISVVRDAGRGALLPGKRISKTGKEYWETRANRSDKAFSNT